ncbi:hypothetical protein GCM10023075_22480 [Streptosporangium album]
MRTAHDGGDSRHIYPDLAAYPAHLHIDLLPDHRRRGHGRALMNAFLDALHHKGVSAVHLGMVTVNTPARAFYDRLGFHEIQVADPGPLTYLGRGTDRDLARRHRWCAIVEDQLADEADRRTPARRNTDP